MIRRARLYVCADIRDDLERFLDAIIGAGVDVVQLREKHADDARIIDAAAVFRDTADRHGVLFVMNDRPDLAVAVRADGVHLGQDDMSPDEARAAVGDDVLIGRSTHTPQDVERADDEACDYLGVGPVSETPTKPGRAGTGLALVSFAAARSSKPFFVTGGMDARTIPPARAAGASGFVVVRAITEASDPAQAVREIRAAIG